MIHSQMFHRVWKRLQPVPDYRLWIYSINGLIIAFQIVVASLAYSAWTNLYWELIPIPPYSGMFITFCIVFSVQCFACLCGIIGVFISSREFIKIYWLLMIPLLFVDIVKFSLSSYQLMKVHLYFTESFSLTNNSTLCPIWIQFATEYSCSADCLPNDIGNSCTYVLLRWMHSKLDIIGIIMCFILFPLKLIVILALREDIQELFEEIVYSNDELLYKHWAFGDEDEDDLTGGKPTELEMESTKVFGA